MTSLPYYIDLETRSRVDLKKSNAYRYVMDPDFRILMLAYAYGPTGAVSVLTNPDDIHAMVRYLANVAAEGTRLVAHNAAFERICFSRELSLNVGAGELLPPEVWDDTQARAGEWSHPQKLEKLAPALGVEHKDTAGTRLINLFSKPRRDGKFNSPEDKPEEWASFVEYCRQDVAVLQQVDTVLPDWPTEAERQLWHVDQRINDRGIAVDREMVETAMGVAEANAVDQELEVMVLTGVANPGSNPQMMAWAQAEGLELPNLQAETVEAALTAPDLDPTARRVLELRQELALVASKKYLAALDRITEDNRLRGSFHFFGAHTGRWAGRGVQLQNLPSATIVPDEGEDVDSAIAARVLDLKLGMGADAHTLKALVRAMFVGPFTVVDYSAIEARVVAWLAGEEWALEAFADGRDIYVETAERMGGLTRKEGKVAVLALGYNGGVGSLRAMGAEGSDEKLRFLVNQWREANENIVQLWRELEAAFRAGDRWAGDRLYVERDGNDRRVRLPSGRAISYNRAGQKWVTKTWPDGSTSRQRQLSFADPKRYPGRADTYGGRLVENATQAVARDVLAEALIRLDAAGLPVVGHVHDEILVDGDDHLDDVVRIMTEPTDWSGGLPISAEGFTAPRYRKD